MKPHSASHFGSAFALFPALLILALAAGTSRGSDDYEFVASLLKIQKENPAFQAEDLAERVARRLSNSTDEAVRWEGRLIEVLLLQTRAARATPGKRVELLDEAERICSAFLQKNPNHQRRPEALQLNSDVGSDFVRALLAGEEDNTPGHLAARQRAMVIVEGLLPERKAATEAAWAELMAIPLPQDPATEFPPSLLHRLSLAIEKAVVADQAWLNTWLLLVEACPPGERRIKEAEALAATCQKRIDHERLMDCDLACALYQYLRGRALAFKPDEPQATEAWHAALQLLPENAVDSEVARTVYPLQAAILLDFVRMKEQGAEKDPARYEEIVRVVRGLVRSAIYAELLKLPAGKQLLIEFALALERQADSNARDVMEAFNVLKDVTAGGPPWSNNAALTMAQILTEAGPRKEPRLAAETWYETARGCLMQGQRALHEAHEKTADGLIEQADEDRKEAYRHFEQALRFYQRTIAVARDPERTDLLTRVRIEPNAWFETGLCHQRMDEVEEACVAYSALLDTFSAEVRARWLPKQLSPQVRGQLEPLLTALDQDGSQGPEGLLLKAMNNRKVAVRRLSRVDQRRYMDSDLLTAYDRGKLKLDQAQQLEQQAAREQAAGQRAQAMDDWLHAVDAYQEAIRSFAAEDASSSARELALYHVGYTCLLAQTVLSERLARLDERSVDLKRVQELAETGLQAFRDYEAHVSLTINPATEVEERRAKLQAPIRQARVHLLFNAGRMAETLDACDECLKAERVGSRDQPHDPALGAVLFARYRALCRLAQDPATTEPARLLEQACATADQLAFHPAFQGYAFTDLAARYAKAAEAAAQDKRPEDAGRLDGLTAEYLWRALHAQPEADRNAAEYHRLLLMLAKAKDWRRIADLAQVMLKRFDPEKKGSRIPDEEWPLRLREMHALIQYPDLKKRDACRMDHTVLIDYLYESERWADTDEARRPEQDRYPVDLNKAAFQLSTIRKNYPDVVTDQPASGSGGRSCLQIVQDEIDYRRQILNVRDLLADAAIEVAKQLAASQPAEAVRYRDVAREQLETLLTFYGNILSMQQKVVELNIANQDYDAALKLLLEIKEHAGSPSLPDYIRTCVQISRVYRMMNRPRDAVAYPQFMLAVGGPWETYFPDIKEFLEWCYQNGVPRPQEVNVPTATQLSYALKTPDEVEFEESVEPAYRKGPPDDLPASVKWRYAFLKRKIEQNRELCELDRYLQLVRSQPATDKALIERAEKRYEVLNDLCVNKTGLWRMGKALDHAIVELGSLDRVREKRPALLKDRDELMRTISDLEARLAELPEVKTE